MKVPDGLTEAYVLSKLEHAVGLLSHSFVFGCFDLEDIKQEARTEGWRKLPRYEPGGFLPDGEPVNKLENFYYTVVRNFLLNFQRKHYRRNDPPCMLCHRGRQSEHLDGRVCEAYRAWRKRNDTKANLQHPLGLDQVADEGEARMRAESRVEGEARLAEAEARLDAALAPDLRSDYLRLRAGERLPKGRKRVVLEACRTILKDFNDDGDDEEGAAGQG